MMDNKNWRPTPQAGGEAPMDAGGEGDWRTQLPPESRERLVNKIMETLKRHLPVSGPEGLQELRKIAVRFEEKMYTAATSQADYLWKISLKMLTMETKSLNTNPLPSNNAGNTSKPPDSAQGMPPQIQNQGQAIPNPLAGSQVQARQQILIQNMQNPAAGVQASATLSSTLPAVSGLNQSSLSNVVGQNTNMQNMQGMSQNSLGNPLGQGLNGNMLMNSQRQLQGTQQMVAQRPQQQSQNPQQYLYQQQLHHQLMKQKLHQGNMSHSLMSSPIQQQQQQQQPPQQNVMPPTQMQAPQQLVLQTSSVMQPPMQPAPLSVMQQNQPSSIQQPTQSILQPHSLLRHQQSQQAVHQQQTSLSQQSMLTSQQQQQHQLSSQPGFQQNQLLSQQSNIGDMHRQHPKQSQRLLSQSNNLQNVQLPQQQLLSQQNNIPNIQPRQLASQSNVSGLNQQQQMLGAQSGNSDMQVGQNSMHVLQQSKVPVQQQMQNNSTNLLPSQGQQSQTQPMQQQLMSQIQQQPAQLQQQVGLQQQNNLLPTDMQHRLKAPGSVLQQQNVLDQQKQLYPSQRTLSESSAMSLDSSAQTSHVDAGDWKEEIYQKIKSMKEAYLPELNEMHQKISLKLQQQQLKQQLLQQQQPKQQLPSQLQSHEVPQLHQMNDGTDLKMRPVMAVKPGVYQQHHAATQRSAYPHQQLKPGASFPATLPQLLQEASPQITHYSSLQIDQQNLLSSLTKTGTPLQSASSPFVVPSPATPLARSPMPGDSEKAQGPSLAIGTPGISALPLLAEFGPDGAHGNASAVIFGKPTVTEQPIERLIRAVSPESVFHLFSFLIVLFVLLSLLSEFYP